MDEHEQPMIRFGSIEFENTRTLAMKAADLELSETHAELTRYFKELREENFAEHRVGLEDRLSRLYISVLEVLEAYTASIPGSQ